jgi:hypothetical protein
MLKRLAILAVLVATQNPIPPNGSQQQEHPQTQASTSQPKTPAATAPQSTQKDGGDAQQKTPDQSKPKGYWEEAFGPAYASNWVLALLAVVGGIVAGISLALIANQTKILKDSVAAAKKAADAAEKSAIAAMGVAVPTLLLTKFAFHSGGIEDQEEYYRKPAVTIEFKNYGQSPAILKSYDVEFIWDGMPIKFFSPTGYPFLFEEEVLDAGQCRLLDPETTSSFGIADADTAHEYFIGGKCLKVYGYVRYCDIFGSPAKEMRFSKRLVEFTAAEDYWIMVDEDYPK